MLQDLTDEEEILRRAFQFFDKDGNGEISIPELRTTMHELGDLLSEEEILAFMAVMDVNNDGVIGVSAKGHRLVGGGWSGTSQCGAVWGRVGRIRVERDCFRWAGVVWGGAPQLIPGVEQSSSSGRSAHFTNTPLLPTLPSQFEEFISTLKTQTPELIPDDELGDDGGDDYTTRGGPQLGGGGEQAM